MFPIRFCETCREPYPDVLKKCLKCGADLIDVVSIKDVLKSYVEKVSVKEGDIVVITYPTVLSAQGYERIKKTWEEVVLPGTKCVIFDGGARVTAVLEPPQKVAEYDSNPPGRPGR